LFGILISRGLASPLSHLAEAARMIGARDFSRRVEVKGTAEIAAVSRAFNEMATELETADRLRRNLMADVAHELRTPLTVFQGNLRAILDDIYPLDKSEITRLYDETRILSRLVNDLHELSLAEARQLPLDRKPVHLHLLVEDVVTNFNFAAASESVSVETHLEPDLPPVLADPDRLAQVLHNLMYNALQHTPAGGVISLHAKLDGDYVQLRVKDTGKGIPAEHLPRVFDRFYRVESDRSRETGGAGLGLAIVRAIVEAHDGYITVESDGVPGHGTTFTVRLHQAL
jgi:two-component system OmpR family sensor kinase/two-component system sensor histidine kinase BaeS